MRKVHREWHVALAARRRRGRFAWAAGLAVLAVAAALVVAFRPTSAVPVATIMRTTGQGVVRRVEAGRMHVEPLRAGRVLMSGEEIDTGRDGRALLSAVSGEQLRLDVASVSQWKSRDELRLTTGAVYIETALSRSPRPLIVSTSAGNVQHIGTRFEVRVADGETQVRVREGKVSFAGEHRSGVMVGPWQQLVARAGATARIQRGPGPAAPEWQWTRTIAPPFTIEGRSAFEALEWLSHETGLSVVYANEHARSLATATTLRGSNDGLDTQAALLGVLSASGLEFELHANRIVINSGDAR